ncbi:YceI family protein [Brevundimonas goettingensis]|uniref:YceI family protein n=1 Tax=Brevundimonas goettingensis TaxID=2774190 RepID=A0A975C359_9CAUL|nr:YceI family protein [Brevundimonas goettingensis]QTC92645.1 YceI family protein [Brevundimonas goettingensis]
MLLSLAALLPFAWPAGAQVRRWMVDPARSSITMRIRAAGLTQTGRFEDWSGDIRFDPAAPETARTTIEVRAASLRMSEPALTARATGPAFLDAARWPTIRFRLTGLERAGREGFTARAEVTVKGRTREVLFPADLRVTGDAAQMSGGFVLDRAAFDIGMQGPWNALMGRQVRVEVALTARAA